MIRARCRSSMFLSHPAFRLLNPPLNRAPLASTPVRGGAATSTRWGMAWDGREGRAPRAGIRSRGRTAICGSIRRTGAGGRGRPEPRPTAQGRKPSAAPMRDQGPRRRRDERQKSRQGQKRQRPRSVRLPRSIGARCWRCGASSAAIGAVVWVGAHLPPIQSLEVPKRPPSIQIVGTDGTAAGDARRQRRSAIR